MGFSILDFLLEAEGNENQDAGNAPANPDTPAEAPADDAGDNGNDDNNNDDNFDIDADLDNGDDNPDEGGDDDQPADDGDDIGGDTGGGGTDDSDDEPVESNTDIFASLTAEEQQIKIMELKNQYNQLYTSCDDLATKINDLPVDEDSVMFVSKISGTLSDLKKYIADYLTYTFAQKSFVENDIMFNRFLSIIQSISVAFDKFEKRVNKDRKDEISKENTEHNGKK